MLSVLTPQPRASWFFFFFGLGASWFNLPKYEVFGQPKDSPSILKKSFLGPFTGPFYFFLPPPLCSPLPSSTSSLRDHQTRHPHPPQPSAPTTVIADIEATLPSLLLTPAPLHRYLFLQNFCYLLIEQTMISSCHDDALLLQTLSLQ